MSTGRLVLVREVPDEASLVVVADSGLPLASSFVPRYPLVGRGLTNGNYAIAKNHQNSEMKPWSIWL